MRTGSTAQLSELDIRSEYDVVAMRQEVRQTARTLGMGLTQQAKISAAISTIARALIAANCHATMSIRADMNKTRPTIEIICQLSADQLSGDLVQITALLHFGDAQVLADEAALSLINGTVFCCLRMWLSQ
jgi:hypothetical protein